MQCMCCLTACACLHACTTLCMYTYSARLQREDGERDARERRERHIAQLHVTVAASVGEGGRVRVVHHCQGGDSKHGGHRMVGRLPLQPSLLDGVTVRDVRGVRGMQGCIGA